MATKSYASFKVLVESEAEDADEAIQYYIERSQEKHWTALDPEEYELRKGAQTAIAQFVA